MQLHKSLPPHSRCAEVTMPVVACFWIGVYIAESGVLVLVRGWRLRAPSVPLRSVGCSVGALQGRRRVDTATTVPVLCAHQRRQRGDCSQVLLCHRHCVFVSSSFTGW